MRGGQTKDEPAKFNWSPLTAFALTANLPIRNEGEFAALVFSRSGEFSRTGISGNANGNFAKCEEECWAVFRSLQFVFCPFAILRTDNI